jgi:anti-anti-sigma factor
MTITPSTHGAWTVLTLAGKLDQAGADLLKGAIAPHLTRPLALDFRGVDYISSHGFRVLMQTEKEQRLKRARLVLGHLSAPVTRFFAIAGLDTVFQIAPDLPAVLAAHP